MTVRRNGFTLVELLVVVAIIALLVAIVLPVLGSARAAARASMCVRHVGQISLAVIGYGGENHDWYPVPPLGRYANPENGGDLSLTHTGFLIGGDQTGQWIEWLGVPAEARPLADFVAADSQVWRCPADVEDLTWFLDSPAWDGGSASYVYNAMPAWAHPGLFGERLGRFDGAARTVVIGDWAWDCARTDLPANDREMYTNDPGPWWHGRKQDGGRVSLAFADGHAAMTDIEIGVPNARDYRRDPW